jgi:hypothetical protein
VLVLASCASNVICVLAIAVLLAPLLPTAATATASCVLPVVDDVDNGLLVLHTIDALLIGCSVPVCGSMVNSLVSSLCCLFLVSALDARRFNAAAAGDCGLLLDDGVLGFFNDVVNDDIAAAEVVLLLVFSCAAAALFDAFGSLIIGVVLAML